MPIVGQTTLSPFEVHCAKWKNCTLCELHEKRQRVVLLRGTVPCDVLFIGEAPGASEDSKGLPFHGPAGKMLDGIIKRAFSATAQIAFDECGNEVLCEYSYALTNLIACIPLGDDSRKTEEPPPESIKACEPRLNEIVRICRPRLVVQVGKLAKKHIVGEAQFRSDGKSEPCGWLPPGTWLQFCELIHPSAILQADVSQKRLMFQNNVIRLVDALTLLSQEYRP